MKNRKDIIDLIQNTDEEVFDKLVKDYPQSDKKKADRLFRQIERRVDNDGLNADAAEVSGVERYRPQFFRRAVSIAACAAVVAAGAGTAYTLRKNAPSAEKSPATEITEEAPSDMAASAVTVPETIDKGYIINLCSNARSNYSALSISYTNDNSTDHPSDHIYTGTLQIDNTADTFWAQEDVDILWKGSSTKKYSGFFFACGNNKVFRIAEDEEKYRVDNNYPGPDSMFYRPEKWVSDWLSPVENWDIGDKLTYIGRDCIAIHGKRRIDNYDISFTAFIDTETGIPLHFSQKGQYTNLFEVNSITYNDNSGFMTKSEFKEFLKNYEPAEDGYDLSFLDESSDAPEEISQEWLYERCRNVENNFTRCFMKTDENGLIVEKATDNQKGVKYYTTENSGRIEYVFGGKRISVFTETKEVIENPVENMKSIRYDGFLDDLSKWSVIGRERYLGRDCAVVRISGEASDTQRYIDIETGITLRIGVYDAEGIDYTVETLNIYFNDPTMIYDPVDMIYMIEQGGYTVEDGLDLNFLRGNTTTATTTTAETTTETAATTEPSDEQSSDIFAMLDALNYHAISCDGLPTHKLTAPSGTYYALHLGETAADSYVWRRPSLIADADNEAPLTEEVFSAIRENWNSLDIVKLNYKD